ncbi:MAG: M20/M25/M40 family metallo-hydrolase [Gemmataceae bacterium]|nr:M20/M25/M40 family metallo-hydrolase [Gemmataceae bacterium]
MALKNSPDKSEAIGELLSLLRIEGVTGKEHAISEAVVRSLKEAGVAEEKVLIDRVNQKIPQPTESGNVLVRFPGTRKGPRLLFSTHMDTVPLCAGAEPVLKGKKITPKGKTALGGDNRTGVAVLLFLVRKLIRSKILHLPITFLFTVREESGLLGARYLNPEDLGRPEMGFNVDGKTPNEITIGAVGAERFEVEIFGKASHAGVHPDEGISSTLVAAEALAKVHASGWFGKITKPQGQGTSNIGIFSGKNLQSAGDATNVVTDYVYLKGEARSHDSKFTRLICKEYNAAFQWASRQVKNKHQEKARVRFQSSMEYHPFRLKEDAPVVQYAQEKAAGMGLKPELKIGNGGLDANWLVRHGIPTITFGAGQNKIHTLDEFVDVEEFWKGCQFALALATHSNPVSE